MARTFKDVPYKVAKERFGVDDSHIVFSGTAASRKHVFDAIFYSHEHSAIAEFEKNLEADNTYDAVVTEVKGHLITGSASWSESGIFVPRRINKEPLADLLDPKRRGVGTHKPSGDLFENFELARKSNVFVVYQIFRVREAREAVLEVGKYIPYWSPYWGHCRCEWCEDPRKGDLDKYASRQLNDIARDFNSGVPLEELEDSLL